MLSVEWGALASSAFDLISAEATLIQLLSYPQMRSRSRLSAVGLVSASDYCWWWTSSPETVVVYAAQSLSVPVLSLHVSSWQQQHLSAVE